MILSINFSRIISPDTLRRGRRLTLTRHTRGDPKTGQPDLITAGIDQNVRGLDVFVNQLTLMHMFERGGEIEGSPEESRYLDRSVEKPVERVTTRIAEDQHRLTAVVGRRERLSCPRRVQLGSQGILVVDSSKGVWPRVRGRGPEHQDLCRIGTGRATAVRDELIVLAQMFERVI